MNKRRFRPLLRRFLLALLVALAGLMQNAIFASVRPGVWMLIPATAAIAVHEKEFSGLFYGILAGALWDLSSPAPDGIYTLCFAVFACICGLLAKRVFRSTLPAAMLLCLIFTISVCCVSLLYNNILAGSFGVFSAVLRFYLPSSLLTTLVFPLFYYPVQLIELHLNTDANVLDR